MSVKTEEKIWLALMAMCFILGWGASSAFGQETQYTYCQNSKGEVVVVTNFTCPRGYWRI